MKGLKSWAFAVVREGFIAALFYLWQWRQMDGAGNALLFFVWSVSILWIIGAPQMKSRSDWSERPYGFTLHTVLADLVMTAALAWIGYFWIASFVFAALVLKEGSRMDAFKGEAPTS